MEKPLNCWEYKRCGRELDGANSKDRGVCPAASEPSLDGIHRGDCAGRACWVVAGNFQVHGYRDCDCSPQLSQCGECDFYHLVQKNEDDILEHEDLKIIVESVSR